MDELKSAGKRDKMRIFTCRNSQVGVYGSPNRDGLDLVYGVRIIKPDLGERVVTVRNPNSGKVLKNNWSSKVLAAKEAFRRYVHECIDI